MRTMAHSRKSRNQLSMSKAASSLDDDKNTGIDLNEPSALGFKKVAYERPEIGPLFIDQFKRD